jgi:ER membrane protein complex subunit 6
MAARIGVMQGSKPERYFYQPVVDLWWGDVLGNLMGFVLTWTLFYGLVRA